MAINEHLPDGISLVAKVVHGKAHRGSEPDAGSVGLASGTADESESTPLLSTTTRRNADSAGNFEGQMLKFNRINVHLANERTYLAWARTVMSILAVAFALNTEARKAFSQNW